MTYDAVHVADWFVRRRKRDGGDISVMSLLKLTYIAHGWHLEMTGMPLFRDRVEAWKHGPVIPSVYTAFRRQGVNILEPIAPMSENLDSDEGKLLEQVYNIYGKLSPFQLSDLTHVVGGPWDIATKAGGNYAPIPNELIEQHYQQKRSKAQKALTNA